MTCATPPAFPATDPVFFRIVTGGALAGCVAGVLAAALMLLFLQPLLLTAEGYEAGMAAAETAHVHADGTVHDHSAAPAAGRNALSVAFFALTYAAFGLMLLAVMALAEERGARIDARSGVLWGAAGWAALHMAPAFGLPPELPGFSVADLSTRQVWWFATAAATAAGLWSLAFGRGAPALILGAALIAIPQLIGAPHPEEMTGPVPGELAALYAARSLGVALVAWIVLGAVAGRVWSGAPVRRTA